VSDKTPAPESEPETNADAEATPTATPIATEDAAQTTVVETPAAASDAEPVVATTDPAAVETAPTEQTPPTAVQTVPEQRVVYVEAPAPFRKKGNRGFGVLLALLSAVIFAILYAIIDFIVQVANGSVADFDFIGEGEFWVPVLFFAIGFVILVLLLNRAGWAAHVVGSLFVGAFVFLLSPATLLLFHLSEFTPAQTGSIYRSLLFSTGAIVAGLLAREVSLWMGFAIAARGRRVKVRNVEAREAYDREVADKRAEYERANAGETDAARPADTEVQTPA
jgi:hypothetical protein